MNTTQRYIPFLSAALLLYVVLFMVYPHYQYYVDPDGIAYLTIAKRYAASDFARAVNAYWSPWGCWLTAALIKGGLQAIPAAVIINSLAATGFLYISQSLFLRFSINRFLQWLFSITLALFLCFAIFWQSFDDLWECFLLLAALRLLLADKFLSKPALWVCYGLIGALAYFAKAYAFPFFILNTLCCVYFITRGNGVQWLRISAIAIITMVICSAPWLIALHSKYGIWTTATAGSLNMSWYLVGHPHWKEGIGLLIPPHYQDSPYYWEDPYFANGDTPHFWSAAHLFGLQFLRLGLNCWKFLVSCAQLSVFFPFLVISALLSLFHKKLRMLFHGPYHVMVISFLLFPLAYFLVNFESRYIWYMLPLGMVIGGLILQGLFNKPQPVLYILFAISFLLYPAWGMYKMYNEGRAEYLMATQLNNLNIHGTFACAEKPGAPLQRMERLAYFSGCQLYSLSRLQYSRQELLTDIARNQVQYFFVFGSQAVFSDSTGKSFPEITKGNIPGLSVFSVPTH